MLYCARIVIDLTMPLLILIGPVGFPARMYCCPARQRLSLNTYLLIEHNINKLNTNPQGDSALANNPIYVVLACLCTPDVGTWNRAICMSKIKIYTTWWHRIVLEKWSSWTTETDYVVRTAITDVCRTADISAGN